MISFIRATIREFAAPNHRLSCRRSLWRTGLLELVRRGQSKRETGAFLLGVVSNGRREVRQFIYYDELDPSCLDSGIVIFRGAAYGLLWRICRETNLVVVADVHTHPAIARQSPADRDHPMIAIPGHVAIIVPHFARRSPHRELGIYEYLGEHRWVDHSGSSTTFFYTGIWG